MTPARKAVLSYLREWLDWVEAGAVDGRFRRWIGLCGNAPNITVMGDLQAMLREEFGNKWKYPFGTLDFDRRADDETMHECPQRLAWVRAKLAEGL